MPDRSTSPPLNPRRHRQTRLESQRLASPAVLAPGTDPPVQPVNRVPTAAHSRSALAAHSRFALAAETDRRQLAAQVEGQIIAPLKLLLAQAVAFEQTLPAQPASRMAVSVLASLARQVLQQAYDLQASLHPVVLETLGLEPALESLAEQYERLYSPRLVLNLSRLPQRPPAEVELALFRLTQDVLDTLCAQQVLQVEVSLGVVDQALRREFTCLGEAFLPEAVRNTPPVAPEPSFALLIGQPSIRVTVPGLEAISRI